MLFNLQGAYRFAVAFATAYLIYHTFSSLSRTFLKFFKIFFQALSQPRQPVYHIISHQLCQYLFQNFFQVFSICFSSILHRLICDSLHILPYLYSFVKHFCITFSIFFDYFQQLLTYPHFSTAFPQPYPQFMLCFLIKSLVFGPSRTPLPTFQIIFSLIFYN